MSDEIVDAVHRVREEYAARFHHDLDAMYRHLKERERQSGRRYVRVRRGRKHPARNRVRNG
jgi:hypothetical protein